MWAAETLRRSQLCAQFPATTPLELVFFSTVYPRWLLRRNLGLEGGIPSGFIRKHVCRTVWCSRRSGDRRSECARVSLAVNRIPPARCRQHVIFWPEPGGCGGRGRGL